MVLTHEQTNGWNNNEISEISPSIFTHFVHNKVGLLGQWENDGLCNECFWTT